MSDKIWLVYSREHNAFWRADCRGYTHREDQAGRYTKAEAEECCRSRDFAHPDNPPEVAVLAPEAADYIKRLEAERAEMLHGVTVIAEACDEHWNDWTNDGCPPDEAIEFVGATAKRARALLDKHGIKP